MTSELIKSKIVANGIKNLKEFGYPDVNQENIFTDEVYSLFFERMLKGNLGNGEKIDEAIKELLTEIKK